MQIATYVIYELLIRMQELNPEIGDFVSCKRTENGILVQTTSTPIVIPEIIYQQQFEDPASISTIELLSLI
ncbi:hypothetical protein DBR43_30615 [Pedobacter sp. KBW06]|uniref:hypothetical protein n=1 Tax=Pedobacter sp. KBW06 TaxID=2153359 RepID=UPI000F5AA74A|nr:hypothetical protein [Pedobacter sp. KBW06]RQO65208.1 hypothetical protein DBR43_30615 [Pedobacter sp. KBW06]